MVQPTMFIYFLITLMLIIPKASSTTPTYLHNVCSNTTLFASKSRYHENLNTVFGYLSSNATYPSGYHAAVAGIGTNDVVYGHFLCRGDQSPSSCHDCVSTATATDLPKKYCPNTKVAIIWYDECMVRYSNESFFGEVDHDNENYLLFNTQNITGNVSRFMDVMGTMMIGMVNRAVNGGPNKKYATGFVAYTNLEGIYGLEQCTPDLGASDCNQCLLQAVESLPTSKGARTVWSSCNARYETYPFFNGADKLALPPAQPLSPRSNSTEKSKTSTKVIAIIATLAAVAVIAFLAISFYLIRKPKQNDVGTDETVSGEFDSVESLQYELATLQLATNNFSEENKLGQGGFGSVYKGTLSNGEEIAVKRLSRSSIQGAQEFKTEVLLVAKLQHRRLVRLLGFCIAGIEKLLVYEYVANKSLDRFLFDPEKKMQLDWNTRYKIIEGVARGILYLHQDSQLRIIHRDLKASNILLDADMNPKISDFGMAKLCGVDQTHGNTNRVVGTYGYMAPEYAMQGKFSTKSDVYSFGVLVLEIISGMNNNTFHKFGDTEDLLSYAWNQWRDGRAVEFVDETIRNTISINEVKKCMHLGLLCVQEGADQRPSMTNAVMMLDGQSVSIPTPTHPAFFVKSVGGSTSSEHRVDSLSVPWTMNEASISEMEPR